MYEHKSQLLEERNFSQGLYSNLTVKTCCKTISEIPPLPKLRLHMAEAKLVLILRWSQNCVVTLVDYKMV